jgi:magnesium-transporting ATPase (P-type)
MDELELLKKDWNKQSDYKKLSAKDIYPMLHKKSSSIVKTLYYISLGELVFWILVSAIPYVCSDSYKEKLDKVYESEHLFAIQTLFCFGVTILFIYLLFKAYKSISVTDNAKKLMENIIKTRRVIKYYVLYNLILGSISMIIGFYIGLHNDPETAKNMASIGTMEKTVIYLMLLGMVSLFVIIIWLFYRLIYGLLLKRLNRNYKELQKLEV